MLPEPTNRSLLLDKRALMFALPALMAGAVIMPAYVLADSARNLTLDSYTVTSVALLTWLGATGASMVYLKLGKGKHEAGGLAGQPEPGDEPVPYPQSEPAPENPEAIPEGGVPEPLPLGSLSVRGVFRLFRSKNSGATNANEETAINQKVDEILASLREALIKNLKAGYVISSIEVHMKPLSEVYPKSDAEQNTEGNEAPTKTQSEVDEPAKTHEPEQLIVAPRSN
jgi:hypothetical protein